MPRTRSLLLLALVATLALTGIALRSARAPQDRGQAPPTPEAARTGDDRLRVDAVMFEIAAASGGDFYFWAPGEFAQAALRIPLGGEDVVLAHGELDDKALVLDFPVDSVATRLELFAGSQGRTRVRVIRPDGTRLEPGPGAQLQEYGHMLLATVGAPAPGSWRVELQGAGLFSFSARVAAESSALPPEADLTPVVFYGFDFVELRGRPGHQGMFPLRREVVAGEELTFELDLAGGAGGVELGFVGTDGRVLSGGFQATEPVPGSDLGYTGRCVVPNAPFRPAVRGRDAFGVEFLRALSGLRSPGEAR